MSKKFVKFIGLLLVVGLLLAALPKEQVMAATPIYVDDNFDSTTPGWGTTHFASIQDGINAVDTGGIVNVAAGEYLENATSWQDITITKSLSLIGAGRDFTIVRLTEGKNVGVDVYGAGLNVTIQGLKFTDIDGYEVENYKGPGFAINFRDGSFTGLTLRDVMVEQATGRGILLNSSASYNNVVIDNCNVHHNGVWGFSVAGTTNGLTVTNSHFWGNGYLQQWNGIGFDLIGSSTNITNVQISGGSFSYNWKAGLNMAGVSGVSVRNTEAIGNGNFGISIDEYQSKSQNILIENVIASDNNLEGILIQTEKIDAIENVDIIESTVTNNNRNGIYLAYYDNGTNNPEMTDITIRRSTITGNVGKAIEVSKWNWPDPPPATPILEVFDARANWYGAPTDPSASITTANLDYMPWCYTDDCTELYVPAGGSIQSAIDVAREGDIIRVAAGTYSISSTINVSKPLTLLGPQANEDPRPYYDSTRVAGSANEAIIDGNGTIARLLYVQANNVSVNGFEFKRGTGDMIYSETPVTDGTYIGYNIIHDASGDEGVQLKKVANATVEYNYVFNTFGDGINLSDSTYSTIQFNELTATNIPSDTNAAIYVYNDGSPAMNIIIKGNYIHDVHYHGISLGDIGGADQANVGGSILNNIVLNAGGEGIRIGASDSVADGNDVSGSGQWGVNVARSPNNVTITNNIIYNNTQGGIGVGYNLWGSDHKPTNVTVYHNSITNNFGPELVVTSNVLDEVNAELNWWGSPCGPATGEVTGLADYTPWYTNSAMTKTSDIAATYDIPAETPTAEINAAIACAANGSTFNFLTGNHNGDIVVPAGKEHLTLALKDGAIINAASPCITVNASYTTITTESIGGAKCIPSGGSNGIDVASALVNIIIEGIEFDGSEQTTGAGIAFAGAITDFQIVNNNFHDLDGSGVVFNGTITNNQGIQGNIFQRVGSPAIVAPAGTLNAEYNSWDAYSGATVANVDNTPWTHAAIELHSTNPTVDNWANQVFVDDEITYQVVGVFQNITGADFTLTYDPTKLDVVSITPVTGIFQSAGGELVDELVDGQIRYDGVTYPGFTSENASGTVLYTVTFKPLGAGDAALAIDPASDLFGMIPPSGPSTNVYAADLDSVTVHKIDRPTLTPTNLDGLYVVGVSHEISTVITNPATGGVWTESPAEPDAIGWIRISDALVADITQLQFKYTDGVWYDFSVQDQYGGDAVKQDNDDVIARFGNYNFGFDMPNNWSDVDAFRVTFAEAGTHTVTIGIYDMMDTAENYYGTDDILLTEITQEITVYDAPTISSDDVDGYYVTGIEQGFTTSLDNPSTGGNYEGVQVDLKITGADLADIASLYYWEVALDPDAFALWTLTEDGSGNLIGTFGPPTVGFPMPAPYTIDVPFKVTFANPGSYPFELTLRDVATGTILDTFTDTAVVYESPIISSEDIQGYYLTEEEREFTVNVNNPISPDGMAYYPVMFKFTIPDVTLIDVINTARYYETYDPANTWQTLPLRQVGPDVVGWYGLVNYGGFNLLADGLEHPGLLEVNFKAPGEYDVIVELYLMDGTVETGPDYLYDDDTVRLLASKEFTMFAYDQPELTGSGLPYYLVGDAQESTTTIFNPGTGYPYGDSIVFDITIFNHEVADITSVTCTYFGVSFPVTSLLIQTGDDITAHLEGANGFFTVDNPYDESFTCTTTFATAGTYETLAEMVHVVGGVERVVAKREATTVVYPKPLITSPELAGPFQEGLEATVTINVDNVGAMNTPNYFILHLDLPVGTEVVYGGVTYTCTTAGCDIPVTLAAGANAIDLDITFNDPYVGTLGVTLFDPAVEPDRTLATFTTPTNVVVYANVASVTGTVSMQGRTPRNGVQMFLTGPVGFAFGPYDDTSINQISNNISFTNLAAGIYTITTNQARYLDITAILGKTIDISLDTTIASLELKAGDADDDNAVGLTDAGIVGGAYGTGDITSDGDLNFDNRVNIQDLALLGGNYGKTSAIVYGGSLWTP